MRIERLGHLVVIAAEVGGQTARFLVDSGVGVNIVSTAFVERAGLRSTGETFTGRRMSGQEVTAELVELPGLVVDGVPLAGQVAGVADLGEGFDGILGLTAFDGVPFTVDAATGTLDLWGPGPDAVAVPLDLRRDGPSTDPFAELSLPDGGNVVVEVDTGSEVLILDRGFLEEGRVTAHELADTTGVDETGHAWTRTFGELDGAVALAAAPGTAQQNPRVMFQRIIHDGLVGTAYLDRFRYTFDVAAAVLWLEGR